MLLIRLRERGQLTLPSDIRKALKLKAGDYLEVELHENAVILKPRKAADRNTKRLSELIEKARKFNKGVDPKILEAEVAEAVEAVREAKPNKQ